MHFQSLDDITHTMSDENHHLRWMLFGGRKRRSPGSWDEKWLVNKWQEYIGCCFCCASRASSMNWKEGAGPDDPFSRRSLGKCLGKCPGKCPRKCPGKCPGSALGSARDVSWRCPGGVLEVSWRVPMVALMTPAKGLRQWTLLPVGGVPIV